MGGARFTRLNASPIPDGGCLNDTVFFDTGLPVERFDVEWVFESGDTIREHEFTRMYDQLGSFHTELFLHDRCFDLFDTLSKNLQITLRQSVATDPLDHFCEGEDIFLSATDVAMATYEWTGPNEYFSEEQHPLIEEVSPFQSGQYEVIGIVSGCATFPATVDVEIKPSPQPELGPNAVFCPKDESMIVLDPGDFIAYEWNDGSDLSTFAVLEEGSISVVVSDEFGCMASDSVTFRQQCPTVFYVPNIFSPNNDQVNDHFGIFGEDIVSLELTVFDRWGTEIFYTNQESGLWDGTHQNGQATEGTYAWLLRMVIYEEDGGMSDIMRTGSVTLIR